MYYIDIPLLRETDVHSLLYITKEYMGYQLRFHPSIDCIFVSLFALLTSSPHHAIYQLRFCRLRLLFLIIKSHLLYFKLTNRDS